MTATLTMGPRPAGGSILRPAAGAPGRWSRFLSAVVAWWQDDGAIARRRRRRAEQAGWADATVTLEPTPGSADARQREIEAFMRAHAARMVGALTLITGNRAAAEDALQDALAKAWVRRDQPIEQLAGWILVVATNQARSGWRRRAAEGRALTKLGGRATATTTSAELPDDELHRALRALPERERQVAVLHYVMDQSVADVASALGISDGSVKTLLSRARQHLAGRMGVATEGGVA